MAGSIERGMPNSASSSSSQSSVARSISIVRLALVGSVTCTPPSTPPVRCQITQLSVVPNSGVAALGGRAHAVDVVEDPLDLAAGEVRGRRQPGAAADEVAASVAFEGGGDAVGARVLPDDGVVQRTPGAPVPHDRGLALVGHARRAARSPGPSPARFDATRTTVSVRSQISIGSCSTHPASGRICWCSSWCLTDLPTVVVEHHEPGARRALVDGANEFGHSVPRFLVPRCCGACSVL